MSDIDLEEAINKQNEKKNFRKEFMEAQKALVGNSRRSFERLSLNLVDKGKQSLDKARVRLGQQISTVQNVVQEVQMAQDLTDVKYTFHRAGWSFKIALKCCLKMFGRIFICCFFLNMIYEDYQNWHMFKAAQIDGSQPVQQYFPKYPYFGMYFLLPCLVTLIFNVGTLWTSAVVMLDITRDSANLIITQLYILVIYGQRPNELVVKRLAILGCTLLIFVDALRSRSNNVVSHTGLLSEYGQEENEENTNKLWSSLLLVGRLLICILFVYVGLFQVQNILDVSKTDGWDSHDNPWLIIEILLAIPFALGYKIVIISYLLCAALLIEAVLCWQFWTFPSNQWTAASHVRLHFVTNLAVSGGLMILLSMGPGLYSIDQLLKKQK